LITQAIKLLCLLIPIFLYAGDKTMMVIETNQGNIEVTLFPDKAPKAVENFEKLAAAHYYDGTIFHRVIKGFMIQGGDPQGTGTGGESIWGKPFSDEFVPTLTFSRPGLLAMANRGPNTNGSQFFITTVPTPWLNNKHTIFGEVTGGMDVVKKIESSPTRNDRPVEPLKILKIYLK
jgi:peptidylprolyl isomerase